jgi:hypothetical protein
LNNLGERLPRPGEIERQNLCRTNAAIIHPDHQWSGRLLVVIEQAMDEEHAAEILVG